MVRVYVDNVNDQYYIDEDLAIQLGVQNVSIQSVMVYENNKIIPINLETLNFIRKKSNNQIDYFILDRTNMHIKDDDDYSNIR